MNDKNKVIALVLCFFLGGAGIHQFYLGKNTKGMIYLVMCFSGILLPISLILATVDFLVILFTPSSKL